MDNKIMDGSGMVITRGIWYSCFPLSFKQKVATTIPTRLPELSCQSACHAVYYGSLLRTRPKVLDKTRPLPITMPIE